MFEAAREWVSPEEYLRLEAQAEVKSEYFDGEIFPVPGTGPTHHLIAGNVCGLLASQLADSSCRVYPSLQRVKVPATGLYTYPDLTVVSEAPVYEEPRPQRLLNPTLIAEVLSQTTEAYDRGDKFAHYQMLPSLREYVLVASDRRRIERFTRQPGSDEWLYAECSGEGGALAIASIGCELSLARVYAKVEFPQREPGRRRGPLSGG